MDEINPELLTDTHVLGELVENMSIGVVVHDDQQIHFCNARAARMLAEFARTPDEREDQVLRRLLLMARGDAPLVLTRPSGDQAMYIRVVHSRILWGGCELDCHELVDISNSLVGGAEQRLTRSIELVGYVSNSLSGASSPLDACRQALATIVERMDCPCGEVWLPRKGTAELRLLDACSSSTSARVIDRGTELLKPDPDVWNRLIEEADAVWISPAAGDEESAWLSSGQAASAGVSAASIVPVVVNGAVFAVMAFYARRARTYNAHMINAVRAALVPLSDCIGRLQLQTELNTTDQRLNLLLQNATSGTFEWDPETDALKWDRGFNKIAGLPEYTRGGQLRELVDLVHPEDLGFCQSAAELARTSPDGLRIKLRIVRPDGEVRWVMVRGVAAVDESDGRRRIVGGCWDETDALNTAAHMETLAQFHEENPQPVFRVLHNGVVGEHNSASRQLLAEWEESGGLPADFLALLANVRASGAACVGDIQFGKRVLQMNLIAVPGRDYVNVYATDVTQLRHSERAMQQANKMEAIGLLAGGVAHDFNNRLTVILGNLELLEMELEQNEDVHGLLADARSAAEKSSNLARQLLAVSRPPQNRAMNADANKLIDDLGSILDRCLGATRTLHLRLDASHATVPIEAPAFEDVLVNLTINARDAMSDGDSLTIRTANPDRDELREIGRPDLATTEMLLVEVTDTGRGMSAEVLEHAVEPFFTTKAEKGTGLGLSMVYNFVTQAGGHLVIESEEGSGTTVRIYLPVSKG